MQLNVVNDEIWILMYLYTHVVAILFIFNNRTLKYKI